MELKFKCDEHDEELEEGKRKTEVTRWNGEITIYIKPCQECLQEAFNRGYDEAKQDIEDEQELKELSSDK